MSPSPVTPRPSSVPVGQHGAGRDRRHAAVDRVEAVRQPQEVRGGLGRAADSGELRDLIRLDAQIVERLDDALGDGVVAAAGAQRRLTAFIVENFQPEAVDLFGRGSGGGAHLPSWRITSSVTVRASSGRPP